MWLWIIEHVPVVWIHILLGMSVVGYVLTRFTALFPLPAQVYLKTANIAFLAALTLSVYFEGSWGAAGHFKQAGMEAQAQIEKINQGAAQITERVVIKYRDKATEDKGKTNEREKQIDKELTGNDNPKLPAPFIRLHNLAAENELSPGAKRSP